jgi:hypothetical protein
LEPGDTQFLVFFNSDNGPFWLSDAEREECQRDKRFGIFKDVKLTNAEMKQELGNRGIYEDAASQKNIGQLRDLCWQHAIPTS